MDRLRKSFRRRKGKEKGFERKPDEAVDACTVSELSLPAPPPTRLDKIRKSLRLKSKNKKDKKEETTKDEEQEDPIEIEPFDKKSKFRRSLSFRKKKNKEKKKPPTKFESDEESVRGARCSFPVKYLGSLEVQESRGMEVCEAAVKQLKKSRRSAISAVLHVSGDGLRVVDKKSSGMLVDQVIEKVSFCSPDRGCDRGFAYISRDGTTRRWLCHCFLAKEDTGERLSHAVGIAFSICLERKQAGQSRENDCGVSMAYNESDGTFTKFGSFRQGTIAERIKDPQTFKPASPPPVQKVENPHAVARPHATDLMYQRQASFKGLASISGNSPFKRGAAYSSLRESALPSNMQRKEQSRISLILEENVEEEDLKNEINNLMTKMAAQSQNSKDNNNSSNVNQNSKVKAEVEPEKQVARVQPTQLLTASTPRPAHHPPSPEIIKFTQAVPSPVVEPSTSSSPFKQSNSVSVVVEKNPWDLVPDQNKFKQHSRANSKAENPADSWLASLTSKISDIGDGTTYAIGFKDKTEDDELDNEFALLANRNKAKKNTNPFKAVV